MDSTHPEAMDAQAISIVIFGASGDLTERKLIPALYRLFRKGRLPKKLNIVGMSRTPFSDDAYRDRLRQGVEECVIDDSEDAPSCDVLFSRLHYFPGDSTIPADYERLGSFLQDVEGGPANRIYYLATAPNLFPVIAECLGKHGMAEEREGWRRIVVEKPYGYDLASAQELTRVLQANFSEQQIYRIDHYLGKETAQNILFFRFANTIFEPVWNRMYIDNVQISVVETVDVERRGAYYDHAGVLRDMFQNHLLQLLTLVAMEPPTDFDADCVRNEKAKVLHAVSPIALKDTVRGQYDGYRAAKGVAPDSMTATYAALKLTIDNWRWEGVPIYLRSGKALQMKSSEIVIEFKCPPPLMSDIADFTPNMLMICIQPDEGIHLTLQAKAPDTQKEMRRVNMDFHYSEAFGNLKLPDAYERLLLDVMQGDASLFPRADAIDLAWQIIDPVLQGWQSPHAPPLISYRPGSWGPTEADDLLARDHRCWRAGCGWGNGEINVPDGTEHEG